MAGRFLFVILTCSFHEIQVQALLRAKLNVNPSVITETDSVTLSCVAPSHVSVYRCYFYTGGQETFQTSCVWTLTGSELLLKSHQSSPAGVQVTCFYTVLFGDVNSSSPHSDISSIFVRSQKPQMSVQRFDGDDVFFTCSLPESVKHNASCNLYFGKTSHPVMTKTVWKDRSSKNKQQFCQFTVPTDKLLRDLRSVQQKDASCDYSLEREPNFSPRSDGYSLTAILEKESSLDRTTFTMNTAVSTPTTVNLTSESQTEQATQTFTTTTGRTSTPVTPVKVPSGAVTENFSFTTHATSVVKMTVNMASGDSVAETSVRKVTVAVTAVGVAVGVTILILAFLTDKRRTERCFYKRKQATTTDDFVCMENVGGGALSPGGNDEAYSVITSAFGAGCPTGSEKLNRQEPRKEYDTSDIYHVYATISDDPAASALQDRMYSVLQPH